MPRFNPFTSNLDYVGQEGQFITEGVNGITTIRWQTAGGLLYDMTIDEDGRVVTTLYTPATGGNVFGPGWLMFITQ